MLKPNRIEFPDGTPIIDLTSDTVTADKLYKGVIAHAANGEVIIGTAEVTHDGQGNIVMPAGFVTVSS